MTRSTHAPVRHATSRERAARRFARHDAKNVFSTEKYIYNEEKRAVFDVMGARFKCNRLFLFSFVLVLAYRASLENSSCDTVATSTTASSPSPLSPPQTAPLKFPPPLRVSNIFAGLCVVVSSVVSLTRVCAWSDERVRALRVPALRSLHRTVRTRVVCFATRVGAVGATRAHHYSL
jgi:hypothetical protein